MEPITRTRKSVLPALVAVFLAGAFVIAGEPTHPSLIFSVDDISALREKVQTGWHQKAFAVLQKRADGFLKVPTDPYPISMRSTNGKATAGRALNNRVSALALTGMLSGDQRYTDKAVAMLLAAARQVGVRDAKEWNGHLAVGDTVHAFAMGYDWLYAHMTPEQRAFVRGDIEAMGKWLYDYSTSGEYYGRLQPTPSSCNHSAVAHGGLGLAALALGDRPDWRDRAATFVERYFKYARDDTGYNYEGLGYYAYGSWGAIPFAVALHRAGGPDLVAAQPKNRPIPRSVLYQVVPWGGECVSMNDSPSRLGSSGGLMHLIAKYRDGAGLWGWLRIYGEDGDGTYGADPKSYLGNAASIPYTLLFADASLEPQSPDEAGLPTHMVFAGGRASFRSGWGDLDALATFTSGFDQHRGHNHRDENSFTFFARGERFAIDPGYAPWETRSHNTVLVNGIGQDRDKDEYDTYGKLVRSEDLGGAWSVTGDATEAFPRSAGVARAFRHLLFVSGAQPYLVIADDIEKRGGGETEFAWLLHTDRKNTIEVDGAGSAATIRGARRKAVCRVQFLWPRDGLQVSESDLEGKTFKARGREYPYSRFFKEIQARFRGKNPRFVAVLVAADSESDLPDIRSEGSPDDMTLEVRANVGATDRVHLSDGRFEFSREP